MVTHLKLDKLGHARDGAFGADWHTIEEFVETTVQTDAVEELIRVRNMLALQAAL